MLKIKDERPSLCPEGLQLLSSLSQRSGVRIVAMQGKGRSGKSSIGNALISQQSFDQAPSIFATGSSGDAVTHGIDIATFEHDGHIFLILDCEGGDNPAAHASGAINVVGRLISKLVLQVEWGTSSESQLNAIDLMIAHTQLIKIGVGYELPKQKLISVVNGSHLKYSQDHFERILALDSGPNAAREMRSHIRTAFPVRTFHVLPISFSPDFTVAWTALLNDILSSA